MRDLAFGFPLLVALCSSASADNGGVWEALSSMNVARQEHGAARIGEKVYVVGGLLPGFPFTATASVEVYDVATDAWSFVASLPVELDHMAVSAVGGKLYVIGGFAGDFQPRDEVWIYDPALDSWSGGADMPSPRGACWSASHEGLVYVFGGEGTSGHTASTFIYDPLADSWSTGCDMPTAREHLNAVSFGEFIYVIGGRGGPATNVNERYDPATDQWQSMTPMPTARSAAAVAVLDGRIFVMGGEVPVLQAVNEVYHPAMDSWSVHPSMPIPRHGVAAVALDERILVPAGGIVQGLLPTSAVDSYVPEPCPGVTAYCFCLTDAPCGNYDAAAGCASSSGSGASLSAIGSVSVTGDDLVLTLQGIPPLQFGIVFMGGAKARVPFGDGLRCVAPGTVGLHRFPVSQADAAGSFDVGPGIVAFSQANFPAAGQVQSGSTYDFQGWYRDPGGPCSSGFNLTNGLGGTFTP